MLSFLDPNMREALLSTLHFFKIIDSGISDNQNLIKLVYRVYTRDMDLERQTVDIIMYTMQYLFRINLDDKESFLE